MTAGQPVIIESTPVYTGGDDEFEPLGPYCDSGIGIFINRSDAGVWCFVVLPGGSIGWVSRNRVYEL